MTAFAWEFLQALFWVGMWIVVDLILVLVWAEYQQVHRGQR